MNRWVPIGGGLWIDMSRYPNSAYNHLRACQFNNTQKTLRCKYDREE